MSSRSDHARPVDAPVAGHPATAVDRLAAEVVQLRQALATRAPIEQAKGIIMAERGCGPDGAFQLLVAASQHANRKLRDVAVDLVESVCTGTVDRSASAASGAVTSARLDRELSSPPPLTSGEVDVAARPGSGNTEPEEPTAGRPAAPRPRQPG